MPLNADTLSLLAELAAAAVDFLVDTEDLVSTVRVVVVMVVAVAAALWLLKRRSRGRFTA